MTIHANQLTHYQERVTKLIALYDLRVRLHAPGSMAHLAIMHDHCQVDKPELVDLWPS